MIKLIKRIFKAIVFLSFIFTCLFLTRNWIAKIYVSKFTDKLQPFVIDIGSLDFVPTYPPLLYLKDIRVKNPNAYPYAIGMDIPLIEMSLDKPMFSAGKVKWAVCDIKIARINIVKKQNGTDNIDEMAKILKRLDGEINFSIKETHLFLESISFMDVSSTSPSGAIKVNLKSTKNKTINSFLSFQEMLFALIANVGKTKSSIITKKEVSPDNSFFKASSQSQSGGNTIESTEKKTILPSLNFPLPPPTSEEKSLESSSASSTSVGFSDASVSVESSISSPLLESSASSSVSSSFSLR